MVHRTALETLFELRTCPTSTVPSPVTAVATDNVCCGESLRF